MEERSGRAKMAETPRLDPEKVEREKERKEEDGRGR